MEGVGGSSSLPRAAAAGPVQTMDISSDLQSVLVQLLQNPSELQQLLPRLVSSSQGDQAEAARTEIIARVWANFNPEGRDNIPTVGEIDGLGLLDENVSSLDLGELDEPLCKRPLIAQAVQSQQLQDFNPMTVANHNKPLVDQAVADYIAQLARCVLSEEEKAAIFKDCPRSLGAVLTPLPLTVTLSQCCTCLKEM